jgi:hypothetical protein
MQAFSGKNVAVLLRIVNFYLYISKKCCTFAVKITKITFSPMNDQHRKGGA